MYRPSRRKDTDMTKLLDPVCGMTVDESALRAPGHDDVAFCAPGCRTAFVKDPDAYQDRLESDAGEIVKCTCGKQAGGVCRCADDDHGHDHGHGHAHAHGH